MTLTRLKSANFDRVPYGTIPEVKGLTVTQRLKNISSDVRMRLPEIMAINDIILPRLSPIMILS